MYNDTTMVETVDTEEEREKIEKEIEEGLYQEEDYFVSGKDAFSMYLNDIEECKPISREEEIELFRRLKDGDISAKEEIFKANARFVVFIAKKYLYVTDNNPAIGFEDLIGIGNLGLLKAIDLFDVDLNYKFSTYAYNWIYSFIERFIVNCNGSIRIPAHLQEKMRIVKKKMKEKELSLGRELTYQEEEEILKEVVGDKEAIQRLRMGYLIADVISLNTRVQKGDDAEDTEFMDFVESPIPQPDEECFFAIMREELMNALEECLPRRSADILKYRFGFVTGNVMTLEEVANIFGVTRERIRQIEIKSIKTLRRSRKYRYLKEYIHSI